MGLEAWAMAFPATGRLGKAQKPQFRACWSSTIHLHGCLKSSVLNLKEGFFGVDIDIRGI
jgi:hypothetical protein